MKKPSQPPNFPQISANYSVAASMEEILKHLGASTEGDSYPPWDRIRHLTPPGDLTHEGWWQWLKLQRRLLYKQIPLQDAQGQPFVFALVDTVLRHLHQIDQAAGGQIGATARVTRPEMEELYYISSLMEEAITSSQLEGAGTTRRVAKEMLLTQRPPRDRGEQMILNNYRTMQHVSELRSQPLSPDMVFELHRITTDGALDDPEAVGRFRRAEEDIVVQDVEGNIYHTPPPAEQLPGRLAAMCDFANGRTPDYFLHPVLRAISLHFWLAYDHPFVDGNGRTARALFYWSMLRDGYWLCEYLSISRILKQARVQYERAFLYTENDDNDLTYFLLYQLEVLQRAIKEIHEYLSRKVTQQQEMEQRLQGLLTFNPRQRALLGHALRHPGFRYTIEGHKVSHSVVYQTARMDLLRLTEQGLLEKRKINKAWRFTPAPDLEKQLKDRH